MWTIGFIGTGNISSDVISGICNSSLKLNKIFVFYNYSIKTIKSILDDIVIN